MEAWRDDVQGKNCGWQLRRRYSSLVMTFVRVGKEGKGYCEISIPRNLATIWLEWVMQRLDKSPNKLLSWQRLNGSLKRLCSRKNYGWQLQMTHSSLVMTLSGLGRREGLLWDTNSKECQKCKHPWKWIKGGILLSLILGHWQPTLIAFGDIAWWRNSSPNQLPSWGAWVAISILLQIIQPVI